MALSNKNQEPSSSGKGQPSSSSGNNSISSTLKPLFSGSVKRKSDSVKSVPPKPMFEQKPYWERYTFTTRVSKGLLDSEKDKLKKTFSSKDIYISKHKAIEGLRKLKKQGYPSEKVRKAIEKQTGITKY